MDIAIVLEQLDDAKQLVQSAMEELRGRRPDLRTRRVQRTALLVLMIESVGQYRILEPMPPDALGDTYRARDTRVGRTVAVTIVADRITSTADRRAQFLARRSQRCRSLASEHRHAL